MDDTKFIESLKEVAAWWDANKGLIPKDNLQKRLEFQEQMIECLFDLFAYVARDYRDNDVLRRSQSRLILPINRH